MCTVVEVIAKKEEHIDKISVMLFNSPFADTISID